MHYLPVSSKSESRYQNSWGQHEAHLGPVGPRWAPCWPHDPCYQGRCPGRVSIMSFPAGVCNASGHGHGSSEIPQGGDSSMLFSVQYKCRLYWHRDFHYKDKIFKLPPEWCINLRYITVLSCRPDASFTSTFMKMSPIITLISDDAVLLKLIHLPLSCCFISRKRTAMYHANMFVIFAE